MRRVCLSRGRPSLTRAPRDCSESTSRVRSIVEEKEAPIRLLLADSQSLFEQSLRAALEAEQDLRVVAQAADAEGTVAAAVQFQPDVAIVQYELPGGGLEAARQILAQVPDCAILLLTDQYDVEAVTLGLEAGVKGYLTKEFSLSTLIGGTRMMHSGEMLIPGALLAPLVTHLIERHKGYVQTQSKISVLSRREKQVLLLISKGANNDRIAAELVISRQTARTHVQNLLSKLGLHSRLEAAAFVRSSGAARDLEGSFPT